MNDRVKYWIDIAEYDLETAEAMLATKRYLYVGFMCHQVIEKMLKAYWSKVLEVPPLKINDLSRLAQRSGIDAMMSQSQLDFMDLLEPLNIQSLYPSYKKEIAKDLTYNSSDNVLNETKKLHAWIKNRL